ncbi:MAG: Nif3-like dinuclear metal center hexameric protein [Lentisphaerae bacterium]|nr:Nif3-like dinuclear metal center hexameric protein [Lentisphaerota bacterium]
MKLRQVLDWLERELEIGKFDDVSNNGLQIEGPEDVEKVAFAVDASLESVKAAVASGAQLLVVHHGISWGGGIRRLEGGVYNVVKAAIEGGLAVAAYHLPLDASRKYGNNYELARFLGLKRLKPAFSYHGNVIGVTGVNPQGVKVGVCSGGAGDFAETAKNLGCGLFITGEASWGDVIAAENCGMEMVCAGHYATETFGVKALARAVRKALKVDAEFLPRATAIDIDV